MFERRSEQAIEPMLLTAREAATALTISERFLYTMTQRGDIRAVRLGRAVRYDPKDLRAWIEKAKEKSEIAS